MDASLIAWARQVKARRRRTPHDGPVLWLFADPVRLADPTTAAALLPKGLAGVILRHDAPAKGAAWAARLAAGKRLARLCRARRLVLHVAGDVRLALALRAGLHLRRGRRGVLHLPPHRVTSSAHSALELRRAAAAGAGGAFLSPCFPTRSHPDATPIGPVRWAAMARRQPLAVLALGGVDGLRARSLPRRCCAGAGAIGALGGV